MYGRNIKTKKKKMNGGMRRQFFPIQRERLRGQIIRENEFNKMSREKFKILERERLERERLERLSDIFYDVKDYDEIIDSESSSDEDDYEDAFADQPTIKSKILLDGTPRKVIIRLDENLCQILPFKCSYLFKKFYYTIVMEYNGISLNIIDITDDDNKSIYERFSYLIHKLMRNVNDKESFLLHLNNVFFDLDELNINIRTGVYDGTVFGINNLLIMETKSSFSDLFKGPITFMLDFNDIVYEHDILPDILKPGITIYRCSRDLDNKIKCDGTEECSKDCRANY